MLKRSRKARLSISLGGALPVKTGIYGVEWHPPVAETALLCWEWFWKGTFICYTTRKQRRSRQHEAEFEQLRKGA